MFAGFYRHSQLYTHSHPLYQMSGFINTQFVAEVLEQQGQEGLLDDDQIEEIRLLVELEARLVLESSIKFMAKDRREVVNSEDVCLSAAENGHRDLMADRVNYGRESIGNQEEEITCETIQKELEFLSNAQVSKPQLSASWIYFKGKVPKLNQNIRVRCLTKQLTESEKQQEKRKLFSIIRDSPYALLTEEQQDYFTSMCEAIDQNINPDGNFTLQGDLNSLLPFFLKFLGEKELNDTGICFLLKLIDNKYIWQSVEYSLKKILNLLLNYRGVHSFEAGTRIAALVDRFCVKYPLLRDIFVSYYDDSYSTLLKQIPFQLRLGVPLQIDEAVIQQCRKDSSNNDQMAKLLLSTLLTFSSRLKHFRQFLTTQMNTYVFWHPCHQLRGDPYLRMF